MPYIYSWDMYYWQTLLGSIFPWSYVYDTEEGHLAQVNKNQG